MYKTKRSVAIISLFSVSESILVILNFVLVPEVQEKSSLTQPLLISIQVPLFSCLFQGEIVMLTETLRSSQFVDKLFFLHNLKRLCCGHFHIMRVIPSKRPTNVQPFSKIRWENLFLDLIEIFFYRFRQLIWPFLPFLYFSLLVNWPFAP